MGKPIISFHDWIDELQQELVTRKLVDCILEAAALISPVEVFGWYRAGHDVGTAVDRLVETKRFLRDPKTGEDSGTQHFLKPGSYQPGDASSWKRPTTKKNKRHEPPK